jgi:hypothetical protein
MRPIRHGMLRELSLVGAPLDPSVLPALGASELPALETLVINQESVRLPAADLVSALRAISAPRLSDVFVSGAEVLALLETAGTAALPWNLTVHDPSFYDVDGLLAVVDRYEALRSPRLQLDFEEILFDKEKAQLTQRDIGCDDVRDRFYPGPTRTGDVISCHRQEVHRIGTNRSCQGQPANRNEPIEQHRCDTWHDEDRKFLQPGPRRGNHDCQVPPPGATRRA